MRRGREGVEEREGEGEVDRHRMEGREGRRKSLIETNIDIEARSRKS